MKRIIAFLSIVLILICGCKGKSKDNVSAPSVDKTDVLSKYSLVIDDYKKLVEFRLSKEFDLQDTSIFNEHMQRYVKDSEDLNLKWHNMMADIDDYDNFGYLQYDINYDGIEELFWVTRDYSMIFAVFTWCNGKVKLLDAYWSRYRAVVTDSNELYTMSSGGADTHEYKLYHLIDSSLEEQLTFGCEFGNYYQKTGGQKFEITEAQEDQFLDKHPFEFGKDWRNNKLYPLDIEISIG